MNSYLFFYFPHSPRFDLYSETVCDLASQDEWADRLLSAESDLHKQIFYDMLKAEKFDLVLTFAAGGFDVTYPRVPGLETPTFASFARSIDTITTRSHDSKECPSTAARQVQTNTAQQLANVFYDTFKVPMFTLHLSCCKMPHDAEIAGVWRRNIHKVLNFLRLLETGVQGSVLDASTNEPLRSATVSINGLTYAVTKNLALFKVVLPAGRYVLRIQCKSYGDADKNVEVMANQMVTIGNVLLVSGGSALGPLPIVAETLVAKSNSIFKGKVRYLDLVS